MLKYQFCQNWSIGLMLSQLKKKTKKTCKAKELRTLHIKCKNYNLMVQSHCFIFKYWLSNFNKPQHIFTQNLNLSIPLPPVATVHYFVYTPIIILGGSIPPWYNLLLIGLYIIKWSSMVNGLWLKLSSGFWKSFPWWSEVTYLFFFYHAG